MGKLSDSKEELLFFPGILLQLFIDDKIIVFDCIDFSSKIFYFNVEGQDLFLMFSKTLFLDSLNLFLYLFVPLIEYGFILILSCLFLSSQDLDFFGQLLVFLDKDHHLFLMSRWFLFLCFLQFFFKFLYSVH